MYIGNLYEFIWLAGVFLENVLMTALEATDLDDGCTMWGFISITVDPESCVFFEPTLS